MIDEPEHSDASGPDAATDGAQKRPGERLAKAIARAGLGSRREAEAWIEAGRVSVNGVTAATAAVNVEPGDRVEVDGRPLPARERTRLWLYHKPRGYVTTTHDPEGRETVFSILPKGMPRVMTIGRLDINTEGLLLLTNDGGLARVLELPETGWLRRYRVRAFGRTTPEALAALKDGVEIDGFAYGAIDAEIERQQADNVWLRFGLREGKNREVKRVAEHLGLAVNRLIRISFGPFQLGSLGEGEVEEVRARTLKDQLGRRLAEEAGCDFEGPVTSFGEDAPRVTGGRGGARAPAGAKAYGERRERSRLADPSQRVGRRAPIARPRDTPAPAAAPEGEAERPAKTKRAGSIADRRGRAVKVERVERDQAEAAPKRVHRREAGAAERFGAAGRSDRPRRSDAPERTGPRKPFAHRDENAQEPRLAGEVRTPRLRTPRGEGDRPAREGGAGARPRPSGPRVSSPRWRDDAESRPARREDGGRPPREDRGGARGRPAGRPARAEGDERRSFEPRGDRAERPRRFDREGAAGPRDREGPNASRPPRGEPRFDRGDRAERPDAGEGARRPGGYKPRAAGDRPAGKGFGGKGFGGKGFGGKPAGKPGGRPGGGPTGGRPGGGGPGGGRPGGGKPGGKPGGARPGGGKGRPGGADRRR